MNSHIMPIISSVDFEQRYYLLEESQTLNRNGYNTLFKAFDTEVQKDVFIKICSQDNYKIFEEQKILFLIDLHHENLVSIIDGFHLTPPTGSNYTKPLFILVMDYLGGQSLSTQSFPLAWSIIETIENQLLTVLNYLHLRGWVHRDVKPENIIIQDIDGRCKATLCDLELSGQINSRPVTLVGTPEYMAPSASNWQPLQPKSDFWSLGCLLYELLTGELPFGKRNLSLSPLDAINQLQERISQANIEQMIHQLPTPIQNRMKHYWTC